MKCNFFIALLVGAFFSRTAAQEINNLVLPPSTALSSPGELGHVEKIGKGPIDLILISDLGFDWTIYQEFMKLNRKQYTMYAITLPGSNQTPPPPMPVGDDVSYGKRAWLENAEQGILRLIEKEGLKKPVIAGNLIIGTWLALNTALRYPDKVSKVIIFGGMPFSSWPSPKDPTGKTPVSLAERTPGIDNYLAPKVFKNITREAFDKNLYQPIQYSSNEATAQKLYKSSAETPVPIMVRYLCEFYTTDMSLEFDKIQVPILALIPGFDKQYLEEYARFRDREFFWSGWDKAKGNKFFHSAVIADAHIFVTSDNLAEVNTELKSFLNK